MLAIVPSATLLGAEGLPVSVEVHVSKGLPCFTVVGLPDASCREARDRVRAAFPSSGVDYQLRKITVNLAPSGLRKVGSGLDLPIALGLLVAFGEVPPEAIAGIACFGELGLDGTVRRVPGAVPLADALEGDVAVVPAACFHEARLVARQEVRAVSTLRELIDALTGAAPWPDPPPEPEQPHDPDPPDLADVRGQPVARLALEVAAAGGHHLLMIGPPGAGKTMLARRLPGLLPPLDPDDALVATRIHSAAGLKLPAGDLVRRPPMRAPHHSASMPSMVGGGSGWMRPGEISCAHGGVLFLDEMGEFVTPVLESLRQPLEEGVVRVSRAHASVTFPARFLLVGAMNPCPCGEGAGPGSCRCSDAARARYRRRLSGPLLDRFDLRVEVTRPDVVDLLGGAPGESTAAVAARVAAAREIARGRGVRCNAELPARRVDELSPLTPGAHRMLEFALRSNGLSARGLHRVRLVSRTLADLAGHGGPVGEEALALALQLRAEPAGLDQAVCA